jgi:N-formylglutamate deformylase
LIRRPSQGPLGWKTERIGGVNDGFEAADAADDGSLAALYARGFDLLLPERQRVPFVFASPHSGRLYPHSFVAASRLTATGLRRSEDAFVDELFACAADLGAPMIAARFPRAFLDVNRAPGELDAAMFDGLLPMSVEAPSVRVNSGLGVIPRVVRDGAEIYRGKIAPHDAQRRIEKLYRPYHATLSRMIEETKARFGTVVLIDCHSMPSAAAIPDVVLGDRYGMSAAHVLMRRAEDAFERHGFRTARNTPYAGGYCTHLYGRPLLGVHALQIEISRALYLDEERIEPTAQFTQIAARIAAVLRDLTAINADLLRPGNAQPLAAE